MDSIDSEAKDSVLLTIRVMFIFSVILILIGLVLVDSARNSLTAIFTNDWEFCYSF